MKKLPFLFLIFIVFSCKTKEPIVEEIQDVDLHPISSGEVIEHTYYSLSYSENDEQAYWVFYHLTPELINGTEERTDDFREDPLVSTGSATLDDYKYSGYDRGHLCPAADMKLDNTSMSESFFLSNMSPQNPSFNRGIWSKLESQVRDWAIEYNGIYVATGPILNANLGTIGDNEVSIPSKYYKVIYDEENGMIALLLANEGSQNPLSDFVVTVDSIEVLTGVDFFPGLDDAIEANLESTVNITNWNF
ncbi:DNA/RNA non-specific endonuclease [Sunxiuqinia sp. A32]|uniref:DNA/RNA non-specific endonuclease n=1 Tax=Sunxiuqinia sp. A32 TaxID=3461496 RepID=UPI0040461195